MSALATIEPQATQQREIERRVQEITGASLVERFRLDGPADLVVVPPADLTQAEIDEAAALVDLSMTPAPTDVLMQHVYRLQALCARRADDIVDAKTQAKLLVHELSAYPADIVDDVMDEAPGKFRFFPVWAELKAMLEVRVRRRDALAAQVRRWTERENGLPKNLTAADLKWLREAFREARGDATFYRTRNPRRAAQAQQWADRLQEAIDRIEAAEPLA